jgi:hypothetical protein
MIEGHLSNEILRITAERPRTVNQPSFPSSLIKVELVNPCLTVSLEREEGKHDVRLFQNRIPQNTGLAPFKVRSVLAFVHC